MDQTHIDQRIKATWEEAHNITGDKVSAALLVVAQEIAAHNNTVNKLSTLAAKEIPTLSSAVQAISTKR
jgi:hypothetical protein